MSMAAAVCSAFRGSILHYLANPGEEGADHAYQFIPDGLMVVENGRVLELGHYAELHPTLPAGTQVTDYSGRMILPGFIDTHIH